MTRSVAGAFIAHFAATLVAVLTLVKLLLP